MKGSNAATQRSGAESAGDNWRVFAENDEGTPRYVLAVWVAPGVRRKARISSQKYPTRDLRARFAVAAAAEMTLEYEREQRQAREVVTPAPTTEITFDDFARQWTSGALAKRYPDHVKEKATAGGDEQKRIALEPVIGAVPLARFTLEDAERAMSSLPKTAQEAATRRQYAQFIHRVLALAVYPGRIITHSPLPKGFLPKIGPGKAKTFLYPDEDRALLASDAPLGRRVLFGFMAREGMRSDEARGLQWRDLDLTRGAVRLDENKTDDPRTWALGPDVRRALVAWRELHPEAADTDPVFVDDKGAPFRADGLADALRADLKRAGVNRPEVFDATSSRLALRAHDLRATFVTLALASGRTEAWVTDRTGHKSSAMVYRYKRQARLAADLGLTWLAPLGEAIPELRERAANGLSPHLAGQTPVPPCPAPGLVVREVPSQLPVSNKLATLTHHEGASHTAVSPFNPSVVGSSPTGPTRGGTNEETKLETLVWASPHFFS